MSHRTARIGRATCALALATGLALGATACTDSNSQSGNTATAEPGPGPTVTQPPTVLGDQSGATASPSPTSTADPEAEEAAATSPILGDRWTRSAGSQAPVLDDVGGGLVFHAMRVAEHDGFYRVVLEFAGSGTPGWDASWSDKPVEQGRGLPLDIAGSAFLDIRITGTTMPTGPGQEDLYYTGPSSLTVGPVNAVEDGTFEDQTHVAIGMDDVRDFQIGTLDDPARVVIDIKK